MKQNQGYDSGIILSSLDNYSVDEIYIFRSFTIEFACFHELATYFLWFNYNFKTSISSSPFPDFFRPIRSVTGPDI